MDDEKEKTIYPWVCRYCKQHKILYYTVYTDLFPGCKECLTKKLQEKGMSPNEIIIETKPHYEFDRISR